jgi:hypothetical protein
MHILCPSQTFLSLKYIVFSCPLSLKHKFSFNQSSLIQSRFPLHQISTSYDILLVIFVVNTWFSKKTNNSCTLSEKFKIVD